MKKAWFLFQAIALFCFSCRQSGQNAEHTTTTQQTDTVTAFAATYTNPVLPGDFADPSVTKIGDTYWATATSSEWAPLFPLLKSKNLVDWELVGHVFPDQIPDWADANFWAPEISYENGKVFIYYVGHKKGGSLCVATASATHPEGPYTDLGPLVCQEVGSIDGFPIRDEKGQLYLIWKEDANSKKLPTPIWGQRMNEARTTLTGEKFELFRNDQPWEGNLVEGVSMLKRGDYYYAFYAGDACCGRACTYGVGVARAKQLTGPWEKHPDNPIMKKNETWTCPGHGTAIEDKGQYFFLYHAYHAKDHVYPGRQGLLDEFTWTADGWPQFKHASPTITASAPLGNHAGQTTVQVNEEFNSAALLPVWQWPVSQWTSQGKTRIEDGKLRLAAQPEKIGKVLAQRTTNGDYTATAALDPGSVKAGTAAGLAVIGDPDNALGISFSGGKLNVWQVKANKRTVLAETSVSATAPVQLRLSASNGDQFTFAWRADGQSWNAMKTTQAVDGSYLPPWDRGLRVGLVAKGLAGSDAAFDWFKVASEEK